MGLSAPLIVYLRGFFLHKFGLGAEFHPLPPSHTITFDWNVQFQCLQL